MGALKTEVRVLQARGRVAANTAHSYEFDWRDFTVWAARTERSCLPAAAVVQGATAIMMIGDGVLGMADLKNHCAIRLRGPGPWERTLAWLIKHPKTARIIALAEAAAGVWWSLQLRPPRDSTPERTAP